MAGKKVLVGQGRQHEKGRMFEDDRLKSKMSEAVCLKGAYLLGRDAQKKGNKEWLL